MEFDLGLDRIEIVDHEADMIEIADRRSIGEISRSCVMAWVR
jgi:hypothetical protein